MSKERELTDLMQYVTNMAYYARNDSGEMTPDEFDKWVEDHVEGIKGYFLSSRPEEKEEIENIRELLCQMCFCKEPLNCPRCGERMTVCDNENVRKNIFKYLSIIQEEQEDENTI